VHIGNSNVVPCSLTGSDSPEKSVHQKTSRTYIAPFIAPLLLIAAAAGLSLFARTDAHDAIPLVALATSVAVNIYFAARIKRIGTLLTYVEFQADRETDLRELIRFFAQSCRQ
jgi:hypothetical protein